MRRFEKGRIKDYVFVELSNGRGFEIPYEDIRVTGTMEWISKYRAVPQDASIIVRGLGKIVIPGNVEFNTRRADDKLYLFQILRHCVKESQYIHFETIPKHATV